MEVNATELLTIIGELEVSNRLLKRENADLRSTQPAASPGEVIGLSTPPARLFERERAKSSPWPAVPEQSSGDAS